MKKIHANVKNSDRVTINKEPDRLHFFYQRAGQAEKVYLFTTDFSLSVYSFFRNGGKTLNELYKFNKWENPKLKKAIERLPKAIEYVLKEVVTEATYVRKVLCYE